MSAVGAVRTERMTKTKMATTEKKNYVVGLDPVHTHVAPSDGSRRECNSPYCIALAVARPEDGGRPVHTEGNEPWRGRQYPMPHFPFSRGMTANLLGFNPLAG